MNTLLKDSIWRHDVTTIPAGLRLQYRNYGEYIVIKYTAIISYLNVDMPVPLYKLCSDDNEIDSRSLFWDDYYVRAFRLTDWYRAMLWIGRENADAEQ